MRYLKISLFVKWNIQLFIKMENTRFLIITRSYEENYENTYESADHAVSLRAQFLRRCENIHPLLSTQLLDQYAKCHEHGTPI